MSYPDILMERRRGLDDEDRIVSDGDAHVRLRVPRASWDWLERYLYSYRFSKSDSGFPCAIEISHIQLTPPQLLDLPQLRRKASHAAVADDVPFYWGRTATRIPIQSGIVIVSSNEEDAIVMEGTRITVITENLPMVSRVIRDAISRTHENRGERLFQGTAVCLEDRCVMFAPTSRAGKTAILLDILERLPVTILSSDKVLVGAEGIARAWPTGAIISSELFRRHERLVRYFERVGEFAYPQKTTLHEMLKLDGGAKAEVQMDEIVSAYTCATRPSAQLSAVCLLQHEGARGMKRAGDAFRELFFAFSDDQYPDVMSLRKFGSSEHHTVIRQVCDHFSEVAEVAVSPYSDAAGAAKIVCEILGA